MEKIEEYKDLHTLSKLLYCLPFELNMHAPWLQLQLSEHFEVSYFAQPDHLWIRKHADSGFGKQATESDFDTGVKVTALFVVNRVKRGANPILKIWVDNSEECVTKELKDNLIVVLKSRRVSYEITSEDAGEGKVFIWQAKISGPADKERNI